MQVAVESCICIYNVLRVYFLSVQLPMQGMESSSGVGPFSVELGADSREFEVIVQKRTLWASSVCYLCPSLVCVHSDHSV